MLFLNLELRNIFLVKYFVLFNKRQILPFLCCVCHHIVCVYHKQKEPNNVGKIRVFIFGNAYMFVWFSDFTFSHPSIFLFSVPCLLFFWVKKTPFFSILIQFIICDVFQVYFRCSYMNGLWLKRIKFKTRKKKYKNRIKSNHKVNLSNVSLWSYDFRRFYYFEYEFLFVPFWSTQ